MKRFLFRLLFFWGANLGVDLGLAADLPASGLFSRTNLVAWCIVPFDTVRRGPEERAAMLEKLGIQRLAYDWRNEHIPTFDAEIAALRRRGIELTAWWFPSNLGPEARAILDCLARHRLHPELWVTMGTEPESEPARLQRKIADAVKTLAPICAEAAKLGGRVGLYNHLGWFGEPENQLAILAGLRAAGHANAGMVYNFHHGHAHIDRFASLLEIMKPHLLAVNLNGMVWNGDKLGRKIIPLGTGDEELDLLRILRASGWTGPVGILGHTEEDVEGKLTKELAGLRSLAPLVDQPPGARRVRLPTPASAVPAPKPAAQLGPVGEPIVDGRIESVRLSSGTRNLSETARGALFSDGASLGFFGFASLNDLDGWAALAATVPSSGGTKVLTMAASGPAAAAPQVNRDEPWKQGEGDWVDDRWNQTIPGRWQAYYIPTPTGTVKKGLVVQVGGDAQASVCYDTTTGQWRLAWTGGFLKFDPARFGLIGAPRMVGEGRYSAPESAGWSGADFRWRGHHVSGERVVLEYSLGDRIVRESPWALTENGVTVFIRDFQFGPSSTTTATTITTASLPLLLDSGAAAVDGEIAHVHYHGFSDGKRMQAVAMDGQPGIHLTRDARKSVVLSLEPRAETTRVRVVYYSGSPDGARTLALVAGPEGRPVDLTGLLGKANGPVSEPLPARGQLGTGADAYTIDTIPLPYENPWKALLFVSGVGFFDDGDAAVCTIHGDVWRVSGLDATLGRVEWRRIAQGLYQPLGLTMVSNRVVVLCRDRLVRLQDRNGDRFTDFYESLSSAIETSGGGHDYVTCLEKDGAGNFYYVDPKGMHRVTADGSRMETIASGFRNANGMGVSPDGRILTVAPQQGEWTPSSVIHEIRAGGWYGYGGPRVEERRPLGYDLPLCWIPHPVDNSSGSQIWAMDGRFGPLAGQLLHLSWGRCTMLLTLRDVVDGQAQGAVVPLKGRFLSGPTRGAMNPRDGQLYVVGCQGWQTAASRDGSFQRVRWTGKKLALPVAWKALSGRLEITFNEALDKETATDPGSYALEAWNYRYAREYGSKDWSPKNPDREGRDAWAVKSARLEADAKTVVLEVPELVPVMQFGLKFNLDTAAGKTAAGEMYGTIHRTR